MNQPISSIASLIILVLAVAVIALLVLYSEERRRRAEIQKLLNQSVNNAIGFQEKYEHLLADNLSRARAIENASLQRQGIQIPQELKTEEPDKKPREHRKVGAAARIERYFANRSIEAEPPRTIGPLPSAKKVN